MKKNILILFAVLVAFGYVNWSNAVTDQEETYCSKTVDFNYDFVNVSYKPADLDLFYHVDSRFMTTITKENLLKARSIVDILPAKATKSIKSYQSVQVDIIDKASVSGDNEVLNAVQIKLLQSADYSTNIFIRSDYKVKNADSGELEDSYLTYYITIIPEKEAEFTGGKDALISYLKENSKDKTSIIKQDKLQPGKVSFTVTKEGKIANVKLTSTSGYSSVDEALVQLITKMPEKWEPAENSKGEKVDQELVFFFGTVGC